MRFSLALITRYGLWYLIRVLGHGHGRGLTKYELFSLLQILVAHLCLLITFWIDFLLVFWSLFYLLLWIASSEEIISSESTLPLFINLNYGFIIVFFEPFLFLINLWNSIFEERFGNLKIIFIWQIFDLFILFAKLKSSCRIAKAHAFITSWNPIVKVFFKTLIKKNTGSTLPCNILVI